MIKKICFISAGRSDYSILFPLINLFKRFNNYKLDLILTGNHFDKRFGDSNKNIIFNKNNIYEIKYNYLNKNLSDISSNIIKKNFQYFESKKPNLVIVVGDRYEILLSVTAAYYSQIPIAHLHGGEISFGSLDNFARDAISKLSSIHFTSNLNSKKRLIRSGELNNNVFNVGSLGVEHLKNTLQTKKNNEKLSKYKFNKYNILVSYHPNSMQSNLTKDEVKIIFECIKYLLDKRKDINFFVTAPNADKNHSDVLNIINKFDKSHENYHYVPNFGINDYSVILKKCDCIIGNSSSGIIEAHSLKTFSINIGNRQAGRFQNATTYNCKFIKNSIIKKILFILNIHNKSKYFKSLNIYEKNNTAKNIYKIINQLLNKKMMYKNLL